MNSQFQTMLQQIIEAFKGADYDGVTLIIDSILKLEPKHTETVFQLGTFCANNAKISEALIIFSSLRRYQPHDARIPYNQGILYSMQCKHQEALTAYDAALQINSREVGAWINKASTYNTIKNYKAALKCLDMAIQIESNIPELWCNKGIALNNLHLYREAVEAYDQAIKLNPEYSEAWSNRSIPLCELKHYSDAIDSCSKAISLTPDYANAWLNKGLALNKLQRYALAIPYFEKAIILDPSYVDAWSSKGFALGELKRYKEALTQYDEALRLKPDCAEVWSNKGNISCELENFQVAIAYYDQALKLKPNYAEAWSNKGTTLHRLKYFDEAITHFDKALRLEPNYAEAWSNKANTLNELKHYDEAITHYQKALSLKPDIDWVYGDFLHLKMKVCSWVNLQESVRVLTEKIRTNEKVSNPFPILSLTDDPALLKQCSETYAQDKYPSSSILGPILRGPKKEKIRIAYFSADFKIHPVSLLTAEMFELHDRNKFDVIAFSVSMVADNDQMRMRLKGSFDRFIDVAEKSDLEVAELARELDIDIAIDLSGPTQDSRTRIFSYRAAPIQVNWLGYPGTFGADFIDYILADDIIIPELNRKFYCEKVAYLPHTYMVDDSKRVASSRLISRQECCLPENTFVYCCFNNGYKLNKELLESWSRILLRTGNSVLWLSENNDQFKANIKIEFEKLGIDTSRIIFIKKLSSMGDHLARFSLADLFLDTFPYNAHTTAVDSLKSGVPVITRPGSSFASRVAASLLSAVGLSELITNTQMEYEMLAIELANNPDKVTALKKALTNNILSAPLFDTLLFTKNIELLYTNMYERYHLNLEPDHIFTT